MNNNRYLDVLKIRVTKSDRAENASRDSAAALAGVSYERRVEAQIDRLGAAYVRKLKLQRKEESKA